MTVPLHHCDALPEPDERRGSPRTRISLPGRYMLADGGEHPCEVRDISPNGLALIAATSGKPGERVIAYIDRLGRLEGVIVRLSPTGFAMTIAATSRKREKLANLLAGFAGQHASPA